MFPPEESAHIQAIDARVLEGECVEDFTRYTVGSGTRYLHTVRVPLRDAEGSIIGLCGVARDVTEREQARQDLQHTQRRLVEVSHRAGMAEIASSVLHNVGNVLNSVNVSAQLIGQSLTQSGQTGDHWERVAGLLQAHAHDLCTFLAQDPKGRLIPEYLTRAAEHLRSTLAGAVEELNRLSHNIDHIKQVVARHQNHARAGGVLERLDPHQLLDDALGINAHDLRKHTIEIVRDIQPVPPGVFDRHRTVQILINLVRNAMDAMADLPPDRPRILSVSLHPLDTDGLRVSIRDTGLGIAPENLTRIFQHGFTTKKHGHGFGLHASALYAREMGGSLVARSDGPGTGAVFTLDLPLDAPRTEESVLLPTS